MQSTIDKLTSYTKQAYDLFNKENPFELTEEFVPSTSIGNISCSEIFNAVFNPLCQLPQFNKKSFTDHLCERRQDYDIRVDNIESKLNEFPSSYRTNSQNELSEFIKNISLDNISYENIKKFTFNFACTHPILNKRQFGPSKLNINEKREFFFISPLSFVAQFTSLMSGFMLMDSFKSILRYEFMSDCVYDEGSKKYVFDTKLIVRYSIVFVKEIWLKAKIKEEAIIDNKEIVMEMMVPFIKELSDSIIKAKNKGEDVKYLYEYKKEEKGDEKGIYIPKDVIGNGMGYYVFIIGMICLGGAYGFRKWKEDWGVILIECAVMLGIVYRMYMIEKQVKLFLKK